MKTSHLKNQSGYVLLLTVLALMGIGGVVITGFTQDAKTQVQNQKYLHNKRVLEEAKQALLQYAYNYPVTSNNSQGPGRLPCADVDNDGESEPVFGQCISLGRLPWAEPALNLSDLRDADGQRLWYVVSQSFATTVSGGNTVNSDSDGTISIRDQSSSLIFDGSIPPAVDGNATGIAAVIIAPGAITERNGVTQDRSIANGDDPFDYTDSDNSDEDTDPGIVSPVNYLDQYFGIEDNATLTQGTANGFIHGPIDDLAADSIRVNDQIIVITAAEVVEMAENAALGAYRNAIQDYDQRIDSDVGAGDHYPWLYNYAVNNYGDGYPELDEYPSDPVFANEITAFLDRYGRVPSIYTTYFSETDGQPIESHLGIDLVLDYPVTPVAFNPPLPTVIATPSDLFDAAIPDHVMNNTTAAPLTGVQFQDIEPDVFSLNDGRLIATVVANQTFSDGPRYYWDEKPIGDGWVLCLGGANTPSDCNRDAGGFNTPGLPNLTPSQVLRIDVDIELQPAPVTAATISLTDVDPDTINDSGLGLGNFKAGDLVEVEGSVDNDGVYLVASVSPGSLTLDVAEQLTTESAGPSITVSKVIQFGIDYAVAPTVTVVNPADATQHANISSGTIAGANLDANTLPVTISYIYDFNYNASFDNEASGTLSLANFVAGGSLALTLRYYPELPNWAFDDGWHDAVQMAYANDYRPDVATGPCTPGTDCLDVLNLGGTNDNKISILTIAGQHDWDDQVVPDGLADDIGDIFDSENEDLDNLFDASVVGGNDKIMVIDEI